VQPHLDDSHQSHVRYPMSPLFALHPELFVSDNGPAYCWFIPTTSLSSPLQTLRVHGQQILFSSWEHTTQSYSTKSKPLKVFRHHAQECTTHVHQYHGFLDGRTVIISREPLAYSLARSPFPASLAIHNSSYAVSFTKFLTPSLWRHGK
jgi:hypothetical protein